MKYSIFGCRLNKYYLNQWLDYFRSHDFVENAYLIVTCEVTDRAKQKRIKLAKNKLAEGCHIYITGCGSLKRGKRISDKRFYETHPDFLSYSSLITLLGESPLSLLQTEGSDLKKDCFVDGSPGIQKGNDIYTKKFIVIQTGCDNYCSFCLTVHKRGAHQSKNIEEIIEEVRKFEGHGGKEVVLTGVNIAAWGCSNSMKPQESKFTLLLKHILKKTSIPRIRLSSLGPEYLDDEFFVVIEDPRIMPHFHLSIQSFSDSVLQRMKRNYTLKNLKNILKKFRTLKRDIPVLIGADIIVGFPGETEEEFNETLKGIQTYKINKVHSFPFSAHSLGETIPASSLPDQVDATTKKRREKELKKIADQLEEEFYQLNRGISHSVLVEGKGSGWTKNYIKIPVDTKHKRGEIVQIMI